MADGIQDVGDGNLKQPARRGRLWLWFFAGFLLVFIALLVAYPKFFYDGQALYRTKLWQYYLLEFRLEMKSHGPSGRRLLGPTSGNAAEAIKTALLHAMVSAAGGAFTMAIGWMVQKKGSAAEP